VGVLAFNQSPRVLQSPSRDREAVHAALDAMASSGGTATGEAIAAATRSLRERDADPARQPPAAVVLLSDGASTSGRDPVAAAREARRLEVPIYTVTIGTAEGTITVPAPGGGTEVRPVPPDPRSLAEIARASGGESFTAETASGLERVYEDLGSQLGHEDEKRPLTSSFAGGALLLLLAGIAMSLRWFGRLI
jgi:Ca-activated chloride channel family protein